MKSVICIAVILLVSAQAFAKMPYGKIKTWHEQAQMMAPTQAQRLQNLREVVLRGERGRVRLNKVFGNFEGRMAIHPDIPGMTKNLLLTASDNPNVVKGAIRTHLYATRVYNDPRFKLLGVDEPQFGEDGRMITDKDIVFEHKATGVRCRIESKAVKLSSQISNRTKYKAQLDKMAEEFEKTGELQAWVNRYEVDPILKDYAESLGIPVFEKVETGEKALTKALLRGNPHFEHVRADFDARACATQKLAPTVESELAPTAINAADDARALKWIGRGTKYGGEVLIVATEAYMV